jgi:methionyl-tRNA synthetase
MLGLSETEPTPADRTGGRLVAGRPLGAIEPLFPRIEKKESPVSESNPASPSKPASDATPAASPAPAAGATAATSPARAAPGGDRIDISEFAKVELKVALVTAAEKVEGSKKLVKIQLDLGTEKRQVVAGIAEAYAPEALVGKKVALVANLKPAKLMGVESNGMILAASVDGRPVLCTFDADVPPGTKIK